MLIHASFIVCDAAKDYGRLYSNFGFWSPFDNNEFSYDQVPASDAGACCRACFQATGCQWFGFTDPSGGAPGACRIAVAADGPERDPGNAFCPWGLTKIVNQQNGTIYGAGPCAYGCTEDPRSVYCKEH